MTNPLNREPFFGALDALDALMGIRIVAVTEIVGGRTVQTPAYIFDDLQKLFPQNGLTVGLTSLLVRAIQEQQAAILEMRADLAALHEAARKTKTP